MSNKSHEDTISSLRAEIERITLENSNLLQNERKLHTMLERIPEPFQSLDANGNLLRVNEKWCEELGYTKEEVIGSAFGDFLTPTSYKKYVENFPKFKANGHTSNVEFEMLRKDAKEISVSYDGVILYDDKGQMLQSACVFSNITEQKKIKDSLEIEKHRFEMAEKIANLGSWEQNSVHNTLQWSDQVYRIFEIDISKKMTSDDFIQRVHPEDRESVSQAFQASVRERKPYHITHRLLLPDGRIKHVLEHAKHFYDSSNNHIYTIGTVQDITKEKIAEAEQQRLLGHLKEAQSIAKVGNWSMDIKNNILSWSDETYHIFGVDKKDSITHERFKTLVHPEDIENLNKVWEEALNGEDYNIEHRIIVDDKIKWINEKVRLEFDKDGAPLKAIGTAQDITEKKYAFKLLEQKKSELETIFNEAPNPMMIHNEDGKVLMINKTWEILTGYRYKEIDTMEKWVYLAYAQRMPEVKEYIDKLYDLTQKIDDGQDDIITKSGDVIKWQFSSAPLGLIDGKRTVISSAMDITELKKKDEMIISQSRLAAMGEMIGMIAHQWRQPLTVISMDANNMILDIMLDDLDMDKAKEYSDDILIQTQHLSKTIDDFRNFFKPDKSVSKVILQEVLEATYIIVKDSLINNNIKLETSYESKSEVDAYQRELMQVFVNIITNAKDSLIEQKPEDASIKIRVYEDEEAVITEICDNGIGIDKEILPKIFDPYFTTKDEKTGTGLGLYMSKMIIEDHLHGKIEGYNKEIGACFRVKLYKEI